MRTKRSQLWVGVVMLLAVVAAACGDSANDSRKSAAVECRECAHDSTRS